MVLTIDRSNVRFSFVSWPQLAMELTQFMYYLCLDEDLIGTHGNLIQELKHELLHFPKHIPKSSLVHTAPSTRAAFMLMFNKYIDSRATWNVRFEPEIQEEILKYHRRLDEQKRHEVSPAVPHGHVPSFSDAVRLDRRKSAHSRFTMYKSLVDATNLIMRQMVKQLESSFNAYRSTAVKYAD